MRFFFNKLSRTTHKRTILSFDKDKAKQSLEKMNYLAESNKQKKSKEIVIVVS